MKKPHKGYIKNLVRQYLPEHMKEDCLKAYGPNLGYLYKFDFVYNPVFSGMRSFGGQTRLVVKELSANESGDIEIETLDSRYTRAPEYKEQNVFD